MDHAEERAVFGALRPEGGFYDLEQDIWGPFVWARSRFSLVRPTNTDYLSVKLCYNGDQGDLLFGAPGLVTGKIVLNRTWHTYPLDLSEIPGDVVEFQVRDPVTVAGDERILGVMLRAFRTRTGPSDLDSVRRVLKNRILNDREYRQGLATGLMSIPSKLRINSATACTMKPHCVYCDWDRTKAQECHRGTGFGPGMLHQLGPFYKLCEEVVDNSYGEPLLQESFYELVEVFHSAGKTFEVGTNGQLLARENRRRLLGKDMVLYVSADAATAEGYARYRDAGFPLLMEGLRALCLERREHGGLPKVIMSFVIMRSNRWDIIPFLDLMKEIGVDGIKFIYLDPDPHLEGRVTTRGAFTFNYRTEVLSLRELEELDRIAKEAAQERGVHVINRLDFGHQERTNGGPICSDPWKNIHVLDRGIVVCLFSRTHPVARWREQGGRSLDDFLRDVWNGEGYREIRSALARGELPELCRNSPSCPIVRRTLEA